MGSRPSWIVVSDFDGTLTQKDIGNELCLEFLEEKFTALYKEYKMEKMDLKLFQKRLWVDFPVSEELFTERALHHGELREGCESFLEQCADRQIPVYVASCGLRPYIEPVLEAKLSKKARSNIYEIRCNDTRFEGSKLVEFLPPISSDDCPYPLDKGAWASELRKSVHAGCKILGLGNGTSDRSFLGHVDCLCATEDLALYCQTHGIPHIPFESFEDLDLEKIFSK